MARQTFAEWLHNRFGITLKQCAEDLKAVMPGLGDTVTEDELALTDVTTANASTSSHGFLKKLSNVATEFMNGAGNWVSVIVPVKASGAETDTGADDAKFITPAALAASDYIKEADLPPSGGGPSGLTTGQHVVAASAMTLATDGVKRYVALLTQSGTSAPVATVFENSLGIPVTWARVEAGEYQGTALGSFPEGKIWVSISPRQESAICSGIRNSDDTFEYYTQTPSAEDVGIFLAADNQTVYLEIRVYP